MQKSLLKYLIWGVLVGIVGAGAVYAYYKIHPTYTYYEIHPTVTENAKLDASDSAEVVRRVGQLLVLPEGATPTIARVADPVALQGQAFFANAQKGDIVLIYSELHKAILYDPVANKIREVAPINLGR